MWANNTYSLNKKTVGLLITQILANVYKFSVLTFQGLV